MCQNQFLQMAASIVRKSELLCLVGIIVLLTGCGRTIPPPSTPTPGSGASGVEAGVASTVSGQSIRALGIVRPKQKLGLNFGVSGKLTALNVGLGDSISGGDVLANLDTTELELALKSAQAAVKIQQTELELLENVTTSPEAVRADRDNAEQIVQAEIDVQVHELTLERAQLRTPPLGATRAQIAQLGADLSILAANVDASRLRMQALQSWQNPHHDENSQEIVQAKARLEQANLEVERLQLQRDGAAIVAPFDGVVALVNLRVGEWADAGRPVIDVINTAEWLVETRNVSELDIGRIRVGQSAVARVTAFADAPIDGEVVAISPIAVVQQGDTTYSLTIRLAVTELELLPGMNTQVEIVID